MTCHFVAHDANKTGWQVPPVVVGVGCLPWEWEAVGPIPCDCNMSHVAVKSQGCCVCGCVIFPEFYLNIFAVCVDFMYS